MHARRPAYPLPALRLALCCMLGFSAMPSGAEGLPPEPSYKGELVGDGKGGVVVRPFTAPETRRETMNAQDAAPVGRGPRPERQAVITDEAGQVAVEEKAGVSVCSHFKGVKAVIHQNHGLFTSSRHSIEAAAFWFIALERCCQQQLAIEATGHTPIMVPPISARYSREHVGSDYIGWLHFQAIWDQLVATQPDMFE